MGEAKRRKQKLGAEYGQPLGLTDKARRDLIQQNLKQLVSTHYQVCGYADCFNQSIAPQFQPSPHDNRTNTDFLENLEGLVQHWQNTFNQNYPRSALQAAVSSILKDQPIFFQGNNPFSPKRTMTPIIPLPQARKYFQSLVARQQIQLSTHYILLRDVLTVLATESALTLLQQLLLSEFNDAIIDAISERPPWLIPYLHADGWIDLSDEVLFHGANRAMAGVLTLLITLPWYMKLRPLKNTTITSEKRSSR